MISIERSEREIKAKRKQTSRAEVSQNLRQLNNFILISCQPFYIDTLKTHLKASNFNSIYIMAQFTINIFTKPK
jgi:hypothetical protein